MSKKISDLSSEELKADFQKAEELSKASKELEDKYEKLCFSCATMYGVRENIMKELGRRSLLQ